MLAFTCIGIVIRAANLGNKLGDIKDFLVPWYKTLTQNGLVAVGNYTTPYMMFLWLLTKLGISPDNVHLAIKALSLLFDGVMAVSAVLLTYELTRDKTRCALIWCLTVALPSFAINSGTWGQCDSMYCAFLLLFLLLFYRKQYFPAFVFYALAFCLKIQTIFVLPFIIIAYLKRGDFSLLHLIDVPVAMIVTAIPFALKGESLLYNFHVYSRQTRGKRITFNAPSLWSFFLNNKNSVAMWVTIGTLMAVAVLGICLFFCLRRKDALTVENELDLLVLTLMICFAIIPEMHERYGYVCSAVLLVAAVVRPSVFRTVSAILMEFVTLMLYRIYFENNAFKKLQDADAMQQNRVLSAIFLLLVAAWFVHCYQTIFAQKPAEPLKD